MIGWLKQQQTEDRRSNNCSINNKVKNMQTVQQQQYQVSLQCFPTKAWTVGIPRRKQSYDCMLLGPFEKGSNSNNPCFKSKYLQQAKG